MPQPLVTLHHNRISGIDAPPAEGYIAVVEDYASRCVRFVMSLQPIPTPSGFATLMRGLSLCAVCAVFISAQPLHAEDVLVVTPNGRIEAPGGGGSSAGASGWQIDQPSVWRLRLQSNGFVPSSATHDAAGHPGVSSTAPVASELGSLDNLRFIEPHGDVSGSLSYLQPLGTDEREAIGMSLQVTTEGIDAYDRLLLQPSFEYQAPLSGSWQWNARVFSTYSAAGLSAGSPGTEIGRVGAGDGVTSQGGFRDVGVGVGVGYSLSEDWKIKTQAGVARQLRNNKVESTSDSGAQNNAFFGGVMLDYRF